MRTLPYPDPGTPDVRSAHRFLIWIARMQWTTLLGGALFGVIWMVALALTPAAIGEAIDQGVRTHNTDALIRWLAILAGLAVVQATSSVIRHRFALSNWMFAAFRCSQLLGEQVSFASREVAAELPAGDVVTTLGTDAMRVGGAFDVWARFMGSVVSYAVVSVIMLHYSTELGLIVLIGVPFLLGSISPLIRPLHQRQRAQREQLGQLSALGADSVAGLRVLRGVGGEGVYLARYRNRSAEVQQAGVAVAWPQAILDGAQVALPAIFVLIITWVGSTLALEHRLTVGQLVAFYGFSAFLIAPLTVATEFIQAVTRAQVGADRLIRILAIAPPHPGGTRVGPPEGSALADPESGVVVGGGRLTAIVSPDPDDAGRIAERLGGLRPSAATFGEVPLAEMDREERRRRIVVSESDARLFSGDLVAELTLDRTRADRRDGQVPVELPEALLVASATDIIEALPDGYATQIEERARSLSGGQRQRLTLARALLTGAEVLVLVDPTSAVDAHSERRIAERLAAYRRGKTTVLTSSSPLVLSVCDEVVYLPSSGAPIVGTHHHLLESDSSYRECVLRGEDA